jgi:hypothetical protein
MRTLRWGSWRGWAVAVWLVLVALVTAGVICRRPNPDCPGTAVPAGRYRIVGTGTTVGTGTSVPAIITISGQDRLRGLREPPDRA